MQPRQSMQVDSKNNDHDSKSDSDSSEDDEPIANTLSRRNGNGIPSQQQSSHARSRYSNPSGVTAIRRVDIAVSPSKSTSSDIPIVATIGRLTTQPNVTLNKTLIPVGTNGVDSESASDDDSDDDSSSEDEQLVAMAKAPKQATNSSTGKRKRRNRHFSASEDGSSDDLEDSSDNEPLVAAAIQTKAAKPPPTKKRRLSDSTNATTPRVTSRRTAHSSSTSVSHSNTHSHSHVSTSSTNGRTGGRSSPSKKKKESKTKPSYIGREVNHPSKYAVKPAVVRLETDKNAIKWWDRLDDLWNDQIKWNTLDHNGVVFPPPYEPHRVKMLYDNKPIDLTPDQEELATMYGVMIETDWVAKERFKRNFMKEFKKLLTDKKQARQFRHIVDVSKCNFVAINNWYKNKKETEKELKKDPDYKAKLKAAKEEADNIYGFAIVDGVCEKVGNYKVEPPGLFRGRGEHPKMGLLKKRLQPEDVILNIGKNTPIPPCPVPGHQWGGVIHDQSVTYIAKWIENINGQHKFVYLHASSRFKGESDVKKYEKARQLKKHVGTIRADYETKLKSRDRETRQLATAIWIIDHLSIRVGNEKDTDEEADTVGVCSLRCEHIKFHDKDLKITLDFLGKDSMRYLQTIQLPERIFLNLKDFCKGKKSDQDILEKIDPNKVNGYLRDKMDGLTAKVFRTHNASVCLTKELQKNEHTTIGKVTPESPLEDKIFFYNQCNKQVAILCNHQRTVSKSHDQQMEKLDQQIDDVKDSIKALTEELAIAEGRKKQKTKKGEKPMKIRKAEQLTRMIERKEITLRKKELGKEMKSENKEIALGTSKINYMDPRITVAWCKRLEVPIEKVFNKSLLDKFPWAMNVIPDYDF